jgi:hypothetical protein
MTNFASNIKNWVESFFRSDTDISKFNLKIGYDNGESGPENVYLVLHPDTIQAFDYMDATVMELYPQIGRLGQLAKIVLKKGYEVKYSKIFVDQNSLNTILKALFFDSKAALREATWRGHQKERKNKLKSICEASFVNSAQASSYVAEVLRIALPFIQKNTVDWEQELSSTQTTVNLFSSSLTDTEVKEILTDAISRRLIQTTKENVAILVDNQRKSLHPEPLVNGSEISQLLSSMDRVLSLTQKL